MLKTSFHLAIGMAFVLLLLATPRPALADCAMGYPMAGNCYPNPSGNNYQGGQSGSNCYAFAGGSMCYVNPGSGSPYPSYNPSTGGAYGTYGGLGSYNNNSYGNNYSPNYGSQYNGGVTSGNARAYRVRWGDTMRRIAERFRIPLFALIAANRQVRNPNLIFPGEVIYLPSSYGQNGYSTLPRQNNYYMQGQYGNQMYGQNSNQMYGQNGNQTYGQNGSQTYGQNGNQMYGQSGSQMYGQSGSQMYGQSYGP